MPSVSRGTAAAASREPCLLRASVSHFLPPPAPMGADEDFKDFFLVLPLSSRGQCGRLEEIQSIFEAG